MTARRLAMLPAVCLLAAPLALSARASLQEYARGVEIEAPPGHPLIEMTLPDAVYQGVTRADLGDVRIFNADGRPVPHAFCAAPEVTATVTREESLAVFELRQAPGPRRGAQVAVHTPGGTQLNVKEAEGTSLAVRRAAYIVDARTMGDALRAIQFDWSSPDGASEAKVRLEASDDLDRWEVIVPASTLLRVTRGEQELERERIEIPQRRYKYLRVQRADGGPPLEIQDVVAEAVSSGADIEPLWFMAEAKGHDGQDAFVFHAGRLAPMTYARVHIPEENSSARVIVESRADPRDPWQERWRGETYRVVTPGGVRQSAPARFDASSHHWWRVRMLDEAQAQQSVRLELGYRPTRVRFLAQGAMPFTLAFGSRRAPAVTPAQCEGLLADVTVHERAALIGAAQAGTSRVLGGEQALRPVPTKAPMRRVVLWTVLIIAVALLVGMALSLLRRLNAPPKG